MRLHWRDLGNRRADRADGKAIELTGFLLTALSTPTADHFLMMAEPGCCAGCVPANRLAVVEVFADQPLQLGLRLLRYDGEVGGGTDDAARGSRSLASLEYRRPRRTQLWTRLR